MSKIIHSKLNVFIKADAKRIKNHNKKIKLSEIQNKLSTIFGWRHFNELEKNIEKNIQNKEFIKIENLDFQSLYKLKSIYIERIYDLFDTEKKEKYLYSDPYDIKNGLLYKLVNIKKALIKKGNGSTLNISFLKNKNSLKLTNQEVENLINIIIQYHAENRESMWIGRAERGIKAILEAFKADNREAISYQEEMIKIFSLEYLFDYWKNHPERKSDPKKLNSLYEYLMCIPGIRVEHFENNLEINLGSKEQHNYMLMIFHILKQTFLNKSIQNEKNFTLDDLKNHSGNIIVEYYEYGDMENDLRLIARLIKTI